MGEVSTIGLDIAKSVFQVHGVDVAGAVVVRKRVNRAKVLEYFGELFGYDSKRRRAKCEELLTAVGLEEKDWKRQLRKYSKGMLQRVGLAQCLINDPEVVFLDEPMSGLDPVGRREVRELIAGLRDKGTTVFMSTHILSDIEALCDEVAILRKGKLAASGNLNDLLNIQGESRSFEISIQGVESEAIRKRIGSVPGAEIHSKPNGAIVQVANEADIEPVLAIVRETGGHLAAIQPVKQSLEELFVREAAN